MTSQHLEMFFKLLRRTSVGKRSSRKIRRALPDGQIQALDERRIQSRRVLGVVERFFESPCGSQQRSTFDLHDSIIPSRLEHLAVESRWAKDAPYNPLVEIESVGDDQRKALEIHAVGNVANERQSISVASSSSHRRWPEPRPDFDRRENPYGTRFSADERANLIRLEFLDDESGDPFAVESTTGVRGFLKPARDGVPSNALDPCNREMLTPSTRRVTNASNVDLR